MMKPTIEVEATFEGDKVLVSSKGDSEMLFQMGYGTLLKDRRLAISPCEALYLLAENRVKVKRESDQVEITFRSLLESLRSKDSEIWIRYLIFRDLRSRGYVVKEGVGYGIDFRVYERGTYNIKAAKYVVFALCEGNPILTGRLGEVLRLIHSLKKEMIVAVLDRRGEIVYYSLSWLNLGLRSKSGE